MNATTSDLASVPQPSAMGQERQKLKKTLRRIDLVFITVAALVAIDTIAVTAAIGGGQTLVWLLVLIAVYLIPYGMIVSELGSAFPMKAAPTCGRVWPSGVSPAPTPPRSTGCRIPFGWAVRWPPSWWPP
jgi:hypothetical protein